MVDNIHTIPPIYKLLSSVKRIGEVLECFLGCNRRKKATEQIKRQKWELSISIDG